MPCKHIIVKDKCILHETYINFPSPPGLVPPKRSQFPQLPLEIWNFSHLGNRDLYC